MTWLSTPCETGSADGITYMLTEADPFAAIDLDHCRDVSTRSIDVWAQNFLDTGRASYSEVTPSGAGCRIWGLASGDKVNRKFTLEIDGKPIAAELFRRTPKALTITGLTLDPPSTSSPISTGDRLGLDLGRTAQGCCASRRNGRWRQRLQRRRVQLQRRRDRADRAYRRAGWRNRSDTFHTIVGHYLGVGWGAEQIFAHLQQFPDGIGGRYLSEGRLSGEIARSANKYAAGALPLSDVNGWANGFEAKAPAAPDSELDGELNGELDDSFGAGF